ncbi:hypothetical protein CONLIGDRAFT_273629 [Coniochaeta ligniaria NRRL 30616]|uniref:Uncharacterized protein n=1 Tax=Coniochaeta ligniaria NRRL 30616 TaxID=1408157 RepID=A0A1J7IXT0_9PEZI|nr:hypothetical protein CONLIGDRAFT_273629 [Coniochaeta ligniaria NRRL 30616]
MPIPNPVYGLMVPFLCVVTLPLAIFAGITTTLAFSVLMFRVMVVYLDIAVSLVPQYLMGRSIDQRQSQAMTYMPNHSHIHHEGNHSPKSTPSGSDGTGPGSGHNTPPMMLPVGYLASGHRSPTRTAPHAHFASAPSSVISPSAGRRSRRGSMAGNSVTTSVGTITPVKEETAISEGSGGGWLAGGAGSSSFVMLQDQSGGGGGGNSAIVRDFEGVGGWRLASEDKTEDDDSDWANINSRLELPLERIRQQQHPGQHHYRTPSGHSGTVTPGEGSYLMMKGAKGRGSEVSAVAAAATEDVERDRDVTWGSAVVGGNQIAGSSGRASVSPNSSRVRIGQGVVTFSGVERVDGYFPSVSSPKSVRKGIL